jgi:hypothetical protein
VVVVILIFVALVALAVGIIMVLRGGTDDRR